jgi:hypothetical protein
MAGIINKAVGPCDCALAFAIPLAREDFLRDLQPTSGKDFVKSFAAKRAIVKPEVLWDDWYKQQANVALEIADEVDKLHVKIFFEVELSQLSTVLNSREVVALIAHWRDATVKVSDFINVTSFVSKLIAGDSEVARKLTESLSKKFIEQLHAFDNSEASQKKLKAMLAERLNVALREIQLYRRDILPGDIAHPDSLQYRLYLNRVALEEAFTGELIPGNRLELFDGLYSIAEIVKHVPDPYARILDLTSCNSLILGEGIKRLRRDCLVLTNEKPARLDFRVLFFGGVMEELQRKRAPYVATILRLRKQLLQN